MLARALIAFVVVLLSLSFEPASAAVVQPAGVPGTWQLSYEDQFSGTKGLNRDRWSDLWYGGTNMNGQPKSQSNVRVASGTLQLSVGDDGSGAVVSSDPWGGATTGFEFTSGYAEARVWLPGSGSTVYGWPTWWTNGHDWPGGGENDVVEGLGARATSNYHSSSGGSNSGPVTGLWARSWHTYGVLREAGKNTIYWDGRPVRTYVTQDGLAPHHLILTNGPGEITKTGSASMMYVDYVRVWTA
jgi:hypothetical protein